MTIYLLDRMRRRKIAAEKERLRLEAEKVQNKVKTIREILMNKTGSKLEIEIEIENGLLQYFERKQRSIVPRDRYCLQIPGFDLPSE